MDRVVCYAITLLAFSTFTDCALAQIDPDTTLGTENSQVTIEIADEENSVVRINGGAKRGANLFHSFQEFNVRNGESVNFAHPEGIENILSRVTGNTRSEILGTLGVLGSADLFIINPNGIIFGTNAALNVNGSFLASTADSLVFNDDFQFSATNPITPPLLTINAPIGLQFDKSAESIVNRSRSQNNDNFTVGLQVQPGNTLALVGGNVTFQGGSLTAPDGRIEVGSVAETGFVEILPTETSWTLAYQQVQNFLDIELIENSVMVASDFLDQFDRQNGEINIQGRNIILSDGSFISADGQIAVAASDLLTLDSSESTGVDNQVPTGIFSNAFSDKNGGDILINVENLSLEQGTFISSAVTGILNDDGTTIPASGNGGNILVNAESVELMDDSSLSSSTRGFGSAGNMVINTKDLSVSDSAVIIAESAGLDFLGEPLATGTGGEIEINASESIRLNEGIISSSTSGEGDNAGDVRLGTNQLSILDGSEISVSAAGSGLAGNLEIAANSINLDRSSLNAETQTGDRGNITLNNADTLLLDNNSQITTNATESATGGDITISSEAIALLNNSDITANAVQGQGGNIQITTQRIFQEPDSEITAASELGIDGTITINTSNVDPTSGILELPGVLIDAEEILAQDLCRLEEQRIARGSSFIITGRGGLTPTSEETLENRDRIVNWARRQDLEVSNNGTVGIRQREENSLDKKYPEIQQSQGLVVAADGSAWLTANVPNTVPQSSKTAHPDCRTIKSETQN